MQGIQNLAQPAGQRSRKLYCPQARVIDCSEMTLPKMIVRALPKCSCVGREIYLRQIYLKTSRPLGYYTLQLQTALRLQCRIAFSHEIVKTFRSIREPTFSHNPCNQATSARHDHRDVSQAFTRASPYLRGFKPVFEHIVEANSSAIRRASFQL